MSFYDNVRDPDPINEDDYEYPADELREQALRKQNLEKYIFSLEMRLEDLMPNQRDLKV